MVLSHAPSHLSLDPKRIAANCFAIAAHVVVFMLLFLPAQSPPAPAEAEARTVIEWIQPKKPPMPPPPPINEHPRTPPTLAPTAPVPAPTPIVEEQPPPSDLGTIAALPDPGPATTFDTGPALVALATDVAPTPTYPPQAIRRHLAGTVLLRVLVDAQGRPAEVSIEQSSGSSLLDEAARKFVQARWHFVPARQGDIAIPAYALVPIQYSLTR